MKHQLFIRGNRNPQRSLLGVALLSLFMLLAAFFTACDKEMPLAVDDKSHLEKQDRLPEAAFRETANQEKVRFSFRGQFYEKDELSNRLADTVSPIMLIGDGLPEANVVYVFESETEFNAWAANTPLAEKFRQVEQLRQLHQTGKGKSSGPQINAAYTGDVRLYEHINYNNNRQGKKYPSNAPLYAPAARNMPSTFDNIASSVIVNSPTFGNKSTYCFLNDKYLGVPGWSLRIIVQPCQIRKIADLRNMLIPIPGWPPNFNDVISSVEIYDI